MRDQIFDNTLPALTRRAIEDFVERRRNVPVIPPTYEVLTLPSAAKWTDGIVMVSDETGGATLAFSDGADWRRVQDRAVVS